MLLRVKRKIDVEFFETLSLVRCLILRRGSERHTAWAGRSLFEAALQVTGANKGVWSANFERNAPIRRGEFEKVKPFFEM